VADPEILKRGRGGSSGDTNSMLVGANAEASGGRKSPSGVHERSPVKGLGAKSPRN